MAGNKMKSKDAWKDNGNGSNESGFSGLPGGYRYGVEPFSGIGVLGGWWSSTQHSTLYAWYHDLYYTNVNVNRSPNGKGDRVICPLP